MYLVNGAGGCVSDQKPLGCWSVKHGQIITCPVVCNFETHEYIAVHDNKVLRIWKDKDVNLDKVFKATLSAEVYRVHSLPHAEPLVLFRGGGVRTLDVLLEAPQQEIEDVISDEVIKHHLFVLTDSSDSIYKVLIPLQQNSEEEEQTLSKSLLLNLSISGSVLKGTSFVVLDKDHVAVLGSLAASDEESKECLTIWNTKFQTLQASKELPLGTSGQLWCYGEKFFFTHGKVLTVVIYKCETSSLAAAVGKLKDSQTSDLCSFLNWNTLQDEELLVSCQSQQSRCNTLIYCLPLCTVLKPMPCTAELNGIFHFQDASTAAVEDELRQLLSKVQRPDFQAAIGSVISALINRCKTDPAFYPRNFLIQMIQKRELSYSLCPDLMAVALEKKDVHLLQICLQRFPDIPEEITYACLKVFLSISDEYLERTDVDLESVISYIDIEPNNKEVKTEVVENGFSTELEEDGCDVTGMKEIHMMDSVEFCPVGPQKAALLNAVLHSAYSETFLLPHLKGLPAQQAVLFLRYLHYLYVKCSERINTTLPGVLSPTVSQIMDWMCLLLDAHFTVMVMLPEAKRLLSSMHKFVRAQVRFYSELNKIEGSLQELQRIKCQTDTQAYSIEVLELI
uniref:Nucleolar protein 11 n=1 Tax=Meleagris gallopavo TaxID=9103 RepID=A0A803Y751_MELGA